MLQVRMQNKSNVKMFNYTQLFPYIKKFTQCLIRCVS